MTTEPAATAERIIHRWRELLESRARCAAGGITQLALVDRFQVREPTIGAIVARRIWAWL